MIYKDIIIIGGGPSGLSAAKILKNKDMSVLLISRDHYLGGKLIKQTHPCIDVEQEHLNKRGSEMVSHMIVDIKDATNIDILLGATVSAIYQDLVMTVVKEDTYLKYQAKAYIIATGSLEKFLAFEHNDLPGIFGVDTIQTMMNIYGIMPESDVLMVGSGNVGLILTQQLIEAGVNVKGIVESSSKIIGNKNISDNLKQLNIPFYLNNRIHRAIGNQYLEAVEIIDDISEVKHILNINTLCISAGLSPASQLFAMMGVQLEYVSDLGGHVPVLNDFNQTSIPNVFGCGDVSGIKNASLSIIEGYLAAYGVLKTFFKVDAKDEIQIKNYQHMKTFITHNMTHTTKDNKQSSFVGPYVY